MTGPSPGSPESPLRVAVIGAGPAGFYVTEQLFARGIACEVDLYDALPTPFGLVRQGVAPDHQKIKAVTRVFDRIASHAGFRFFGNVEIGRHLSLADLRDHYHQVCLATGAQADRKMNVPGEDLRGSHAATEFVAWYNGHPGYRDRAFDLSAQRVAIIGVGNVAVDVARILCRRAEELATTDIADHALEGADRLGAPRRRARSLALRRSRVEVVSMIGRRGPAETAFTLPELRELGELEDVDVEVPADEAALDTVSTAWLAAHPDRDTSRKCELLLAWSKRPRKGGKRRLVLRFRRSPVAIEGDARGRVAAVCLVRNRLVLDADGAVRAEPTGEEERLPVELVFRSVGYRGIALPGLPFDERRGVVPSDHGRVVERAGGTAVVGFYVAGWIKRGASGVIGTNKPDAGETVDSMVADVRDGRTLRPIHPDGRSIECLVRAQQPDAISYADWLALDAIETERGRMRSRPRVKLSSADEMLAALRERAREPGTET